MNQFPRKMVLTLIALMTIVLAGCGSSANNRPSLPNMPVATIAPVATEAPVDTNGPQSAWERIQQTGTIVVGISADYPPFSYYGANFVPVGFEPALMSAIGKELGVQVELVDMAFEGLPAALQLGQIDLAIAAISVTPERSAVLDFSDVYFVSQSAVLANEQISLDTINSLDELRPYRIGVQRGTIYEQQLKNLMPLDNVQAYGLLDNAVRDLREGMISAVILDAPAAQSVALENGIRVLVEGLDREQYAIAMVKGSTTLRSEINRAIQTTRESGLLAQLAGIHLAIKEEHVIPVPTPEPEVPTATPAPAQPTATTQAPVATAVPPVTACIDGMKWAADLNYDDRDMTAPTVFQPGQSFTKSWRVLNNGTCTWDSSYALTFVQGNAPGAQMNGQPLGIVGVVPPGATYDLSLNLTAPQIPGVYQGFWQMRNGQRVPFGQRIWAGIQVPGAPTPPPAPTQTPSAGISFTADRTNIRAGERVVFNWNVQNINAVFFYAQGESWQDKGVGGTDSREAYPNTTTTYELRVVKRDQSVEVRQIRIDVQGVIGAPNIIRFSSDQGGQISQGQCVTLRWEVQGSINNVRLSRNADTLWDGAPVQGNRQDCPPGPGNYSYYLDANGSGGSNRSLVSVNVMQQAQPTATPAPQAPVINSFTASPNAITQGGCVNLAWNFTGQDLAVVRIFRNGEGIARDVPMDGSMQDCPPNPGQVTYTLQVDSEFGGSAQQSAQVDVQPGQAQQLPSNPPAISVFASDVTQISLGQCVNMNWEYSGTGLAAVRLLRNDVEIAFDLPTPGNFQDCLNDASLAGLVVYVLAVDSESSGSARKEVWVTLNN